MTTQKPPLYTTKWVHPFPDSIKHGDPAMLFVDGENFAARYRNTFKRLLEDGNVYLGEQNEGHPHVHHHSAGKNDIYVWSSKIAFQIRQSVNLIRTYYFTSAIGSPDLLTEIEDRLIELGVEEPHVFKKTKGKGSKQVDITLAVSSLTHAQKGNYRIAILIAGDEDYVPLVEAIKREGLIVVLWFLNDGLSPVLKRAADHYFDIGRILFNKRGW